jgi:hypothetical protein
MATQYTFGKIVTDGLVLALDAADRNSYVGGSTVWNDVSGNNYTGSLVNGPTFSNNSIVFDGVDDYVDCGLSTFQPTQITLSVWVSRTALFSGGIIIRGNVNEAGSELGLSFGYTPAFGPGGSFPADY